ncbi:mechanosensitive ion channel family protein [Roseomonas sp. M0104]|uniref:Small-conductance mechanosensitive channel n=1 Tax=Teichococcus coralli TaxID=2545983 RepID=A0A845B660_9PROT|nr:mechanosensitive ion channel family protein [Pseudoroseomonas coralli]MXP62145.1 mechanosensitive ion channel family protein [Pseudoroseomonas coralli]
MPDAFAQALPSGAGSSAAEQISASVDGLQAKLEGWLDGLIVLLPNIIVAALVLGLFWLFGSITQRSFNHWAVARRRENLGAVLGGFLKLALIIAGGLLAITIVLPSLNPGDLVAGLGVGSVAIGFAFKDILQNWLAGVLILLRQPFRPGDQIVINGFEGTVEHVEARVTAIRTYDSRMVLVPNSDVYTNAVLVNTAFAKSRSQFDVGIGYGDDIRTARGVILKAIHGLEGVEAEPAPEVLVQDLAAYQVALRIFWWSDPRRHDRIHTRSRVVEAVKYALDGAGIDMPFETQVHLLHDQTDELDGRRGKQREGWPAPSGQTQRPRFEALRPEARPGGRPEQERAAE